MSQGSLTIPTTGTLTALAIVTALNAAHANLASNCSGNTDPSTLSGGVQPYSWWADTGNNLLKLRNGANNAWLTIGDLTAANLGLITASSAASTYLTQSSAASTYQTQAGMSSYLTTASAASTYQTISGMSSYLTTSAAASTYQTQAGMSSYLTTASAASTYQTQTGMSSYLTTASAASTYLTISSASSTYAPKASPWFTGTPSTLSGSFNNVGTAQTITITDTNTGTVTVTAVQGGVGSSVWIIPFVKRGGSLVLGTAQKAILTADPITSISVSSGNVSVTPLAANTYITYSIQYTPLAL